MPPQMKTKQVDIKDLLVTIPKYNLFDMLNVLKQHGYIIDYSTEYMSLGFLTIHYDVAMEVRVLNAIGQDDYDELL